MVTIYDIANKLKLSTATVSRALNGHDDVKTSTKNRILETAKEMGYLPNSMARSLTTKKSWNIGLLFSDDQNSGFKHIFFANVINEIIDSAAKRGYDVSIISGNIGMRKTSYLEHARYRMLDGIIIATIDTRQEDVQNLIKSDLPVALIDQNFSESICVNSKNIKGIKSLVNHLYDKGYRKITYITGQLDNYVSKDRKKAFLDITKSLNISNLCSTVEGVFTDSKLAYELTKDIMSKENRPEAIMYPDDTAAIGGLKYLLENGYSIPNDVAICGYDGVEISQLVTPRLTTIKQDIHKLGSSVTYLLIDEIEGKKPSRKTWVDVELLVGETT
ncbi:MAG: LacI family DNA-binding transcriptional regulator [Candidatus Izemoplasmatales bacterium]|nr:LacI family DNA-binding transcriptional regulator [Candidatus Izemoplasmatales bacterium]MDD4069567.1 LacI family DNA-binding transcriptional regulator [Candidatus Izemoplasmatales bacterium]